MKKKYSWAKKQQGLPYTGVGYLFGGISCMASGCSYKLNEFLLFFCSLHRKLLRASPEQQQQLLQLSPLSGASAVPHPLPPPVGPLGCATFPATLQIN